MTKFAPVSHRLAANAGHAPQAEALVYGPTRLRYADLWASVASVASFLRAHGLQPGDRVAVLLKNSPDYVSAYYGALAAGAVAVGMNHAARARELSSWLAHCGATWLFADAQHPDFARVAASRPSAVNVVTRIAGDASLPWPEPGDGDPCQPADVGPEDPAAIIYTSGTTGQPKGVVLTHGNLSANVSSIIDYLELTSNDRVLNLLPFFYSYGNSVLHSHLAAGGAIVIENSLAYPPQILQRMVAERVTGFPGVPSTFAVLLQSTDLRTFDLRSLRYMTQAGGAMPASHVRRVRELVPHARFFVMYGQTEATARLTYLPPEHLDAKPGSVGVPIPGVELEVRSESDIPLPPGEIGEVCVRGANVMVGYYRDAEATSSVLRNGWLHTGDIGYLDAQGFLYLQGRRSDMIKSGAHRISPLDIEEVISALPDVAEVAVVGIPDEVLGEAVKAVVILREGATIDALAIQRHCSLELPRYKVPRVVELAARLPRTSSGKIMRYRLAGLEKKHGHQAHTA
jgi:long-chain acyl-CoA synthetase